LIYNTIILYLKEIFEERGYKGMTSYDLIWKLIELLLQSNNNKDQEENKE